MEIPWSWVTEGHIKKYGYSGSIIRALRVKNNLTRSQLARILHKRISTVKRIETTDKIGIKLSKQLSIIFKVDNWRVFRNKSIYLQERGSSE